MSKAFAACRTDCGWIPKTSVADTPENCEEWINKTYVSGTARRQFKVIPVVVQKDGIIRKAATHKRHTMG